jgi:hypothetical protein
MKQKKVGTIILIQDSDYFFYVFNSLVWYNLIFLPFITKLSTKLGANYLQNYQNELYHLFVTQHLYNDTLIM